MDRRTLPSCTDCNRKVMYLLNGEYSERCRVHVTDQEIQQRNRAYTEHIQLALAQADDCNCVLPEHSCRACRPETWDHETELEF